MPLSVRMRHARFFMRDVATRLPFRFGAVTITGFPLLHVAVEIEHEGRRAIGYAADNLAPKWFDKDPAKSAARNVDDLLTSAEIAAATYEAAGAAPSLFALWRAAYPECGLQAAAKGLNKLTGAFGSALFERAIIEALGRMHRASLRDMLRHDALGLRPAEIHPNTNADHLQRWLAISPAGTVAVRHTVGMLDPLTDAEVAKDVPDDGLPRSLEADIRRYGLRWFKLKLAGDVAQDVARLEAIAALLDRSIDEPYHATLDGNEQYKSVADLEALLAGIEGSGKLTRLRRSLLFLEQPLERGMSLDSREAVGIARFGRKLPVIIDESDDDPMSFAQAVALGYAGVSTKNCKGVVKSFLNRTLVEAHRAEGRHVFMSAEDLTNLPVVPLQQDLLTVRTLGIDHVERNGHHYVRGLDHCSDQERVSALARHGDLYGRDGSLVSLRISNGRLSTTSLEVPGYGVGFEPDLAAMAPLDDWRKLRA